MQKYFLILTIAVTAVIFLPQTANAQWTNPYETYRTNDLIRRTPKKKTVRKNVGKSNRQRPNKTSKKVVRRKTRKISQNPDAVPKFELVLNLPKSSDTASTIFSTKAKSLPLDTLRAHPVNCILVL